MEKKVFNIGEAFRWAFKTFLDQIVLFLLLSCVLAGVYLAAAFAQTGLMALLARRMSEDNPLILVLFGLTVAVLSAFFMWLLLGVIKIMLELYDHGKAELKTLFSQAHLIVPFASATFLFALLITAGTAFFVIPGIYFFCRYFFFSYAMVDKNLDVLEAFQESSRLTEGARWHILGLSVVGSIITMIPFLWFVATLAFIYAYRKQQENNLQLPAVAE